METAPPKTAFLELGSTSIKFYVLEAANLDGEEASREIKIPWDLGYDVFEHGRISPRSISCCLRTLRKLQTEWPDVPFSTVTAVGTSALREAQNVEILKSLLAEQLGINIRIIPGGIEAFLLETGFRDMVEEYPTGLFDLGGGSLELIEYLAPPSTRKTSLPVGAIRLHCQLRRTQDLFAYIREGRSRVARDIHDNLPQPLPRYPELTGTGGTVRAVARCLGRDEIHRADLSSLIQREVRGPVWNDLPPHRRLLLLPGLLAIEGLCAALGTERIVHRTASVKRGLVAFTSMLPSIV